MKYGYLLPKAICKTTETLGQLFLYRLKRAKNVDYERKIRYSQDERLYLNICKPKSEQGKLPVLVYIHGGGWISGKPEYRESLVSNIAAEGYFTINIFYGYSPRYGHPHAVRNIYDALAWLVQNKDKYNIDLDRVYAGGESAGAHLAATVGAASSNEDYKSLLNLNPISRDIRFCGLVLICGIYDMEEAAHTGFPFMGCYIEAFCGKNAKALRADKDGRAVSPIDYVTEAYPPSFIISARHDALRGGSKTLADKLESLGVKCVSHCATGMFAVHAYLVAQALPQSKQTMPLVLDFIKNGIK